MSTRTHTHTSSGLHFSVQDYKLFMIILCKTHSVTMEQHFAEKPPSVSSAFNFCLMDFYTNLLHSDFLTTEKKNMFHQLWEAMVINSELSVSCSEFQVCRSQEL